ncbi:MAG: TrkH family potassium uptake protein [Clostridiales bacterium]|nr:TrkH family potassium uptake protein [Clostridiales bacterium]
MNILLLLKLIGSILLVEGAAMLPALVISLLYGGSDAMAFVWTILILCAVGLPLRLLCKPEQNNLRAKEGFLAVALSWVLLSIFGALPFVFSGMIPNFIDALFEAVSGFTTTGASILTQIEGNPHGVMFWRSFTHWIGGMGVLVLTLALLPQMGGRTSHLVRAESPGPTLSKIAPKMGDTAKILYLVYGVLTLLNWLALLLAGMNPYDAAIHALGTAGTGGFSNYAASVGHFNSVWIEAITTFFMVVFGVNFVLYFKLVTGSWREGLRNEELRWYLGIYVGITLLLTLVILPTSDGGTFLNSLRYASFQAASLMSTTGYATADFNLWPAAAKMLLLLVMFTGSCAGSTAGGMKICRIGMLTKQGIREVRRTFQPRKVQVVRFEGKGVEESVLSQVAVFAFMYILLILLGAMLISLDGVHADFETNITAAITCVSNVGPGFGAVGPMGSFAGYSAYSKLILSFLMLAGRLEIFPLLALFHPAIWRR